MKKVITTIFLICCLFINLIPAASADKYVFQDVTEGCGYRAAIEDLYDANIITGHGGKFRPKSKTTYAEAITMLERAFGDENNLPEWKWWKTQDEAYKSWNNTWTSLVDENTVYTDKIPRNEAIRLLFDIVDFKTDIFYVKAISNQMIQLLKILQYKMTPDLVGCDYISREKFCCLVNWMRNEGINNVQNFNLVIESNIISYHFNDDKTEKNQTAVETATFTGLITVPQCVIKAFIQNKGTIEIYDNNIWSESYTGPYLRYAGFYTSKNKSIKIRCDKYWGIIHELGHFVTFTYPSGKNRAQEIFNNGDEVSKIVSIAKSDYAETNELEFFAEAFRVYCSNPKSIQEQMPNTYQLIIDAIEYLEINYN